MGHVIGDRNYWQQRTLDISEEVGRGKLWFWPKQIEAESDFNVHALSPAGAQGIAQFMPGTAASRGVDPWNPEQALRGSAQLVNEYLDRYGGDPVAALIAYNAGPAWITPGDPKYLPRDVILSDAFAGGETKRYVERILTTPECPMGYTYDPATNTCKSWVPGGIVPNVPPGKNLPEWKNRPRLPGIDIEGAARRVVESELAKAKGEATKAIPDVLVAVAVIVVALGLAAGGVKRILP